MEGKGNTLSSSQNRNYYNNNRKGIIFSDSIDDQIDSQMHALQMPGVGSQMDEDETFFDDTMFSQSQYMQSQSQQMMQSNSSHIQQVQLASALDAGSSYHPPYVHGFGKKDGKSRIVLQVGGNLVPTTRLDPYDYDVLGIKGSHTALFRTVNLYNTTSSHISQCHDPSSASLLTQVMT